MRSATIHTQTRHRILGALGLLLGIGQVQAQTPVDVLNQFTGSDSQREVARAIGTLCPPGNRLSTRLQQDCNSLVGAAFGGDGAVRNAISRITPDQVRTAIDRGQVLGGGTVSSASGVSYGGVSRGPGGGGSPLVSDRFSADGYRYASVQDEVGAWGFYLTLASDQSDREASLNQDGYDGDGRSLTLGVDRRFDGGWTFGGSVVFGRSDVDFADDFGSLDIDQRGFNLHASWSGQTGWYASSLLSFGFRDTDQTRRIQYTLGSGTTVNQAYGSSFDTDTRQFAVTLGHRFDHGTWAIDPYAQLEQLQAEAEGYSETASAPEAAGAGWAVQVGEQDEDYLRGTLGLRASWVISGDRGVYLPFLDLGLVRMLDADESDTRVNYTGDLSAAVGQQRLDFAMRADAEDDTWGRAAVGISAQFAEGRAAFLRYAQNFGQDRYRFREVQLGGRFEF